MNLRATVSRSRRPSLTAMALAAVLGVSLSACAPQYRNHGYTPTDAELAEIVVGVDTRDSVTETIGAPTSTGVLADSDYYYVSGRMRYFGAAEPKEVERKQAEEEAAEELKQTFEDPQSASMETLIDDDEGSDSEE